MAEIIPFLGSGLWLKQILESFKDDNLVGIRLDMREKQVSILTHLLPDKLSSLDEKARPFLGYCGYQKIKYDRLEATGFNFRYSKLADLELIKSIALEYRLKEYEFLSPDVMWICSPSIVLPD